jgi:lactoylglutathione lyase
MYIKIIGFISAILTTTSFLPQAIKTWKTRSTEDLSPIMFVLFFLGIAGWLFYGIFIDDLPMILANSVTICLAGIILFFIIKNKKTQHIHHVALYVSNLEKMKLFYLENFDAKAGKKYINPKTNFTSYFISFNSGCKLELMNLPEIENKMGYNHFTISVGSRTEVEKVTSQLMSKGYKINSGPRLTGDGFYESLISDPEGNLIEITV